MYLIMLNIIHNFSTPTRNKLLKQANLPQLASDFGVMDYLSTQQDDFRNPHPSVIKPVMLFLLNKLITNVEQWM